MLLVHKKMPVLIVTELTRQSIRMIHRGIVNSFYFATASAIKGLALLDLECLRTDELIGSLFCGRLLTRNVADPCLCTGIVKP